MNELIDHAEMDNHRRLEEQVEGAEQEALDYNYGGYDVLYYDEGEAFETEDVNYGTTSTTIQSKVEAYEAEAANIFSTAPAEWNTAQWDLLFALFGSILVTCCVISAFFAYCCIFREDDDIHYRKKHRSLIRRRRYKEKEDDGTVTTEATKDISLLGAFESRTYSPRSTFSRRSWVSDGDFASGDETVDTHDEKSYSAPSAPPTTKVSNRSGRFAAVYEVDENSVDENSVDESAIEVDEAAIPR